MSILGCNPKAAAALDAYARGGWPLHAILIEGPPGSGKSTLARLFARAAQCTGDAPPCGVCRGCEKVDANIHPDVLFFEGQGRAGSFHVDTVRDLRARAFVRPNEGRHTVLILEEAQTMTVGAQNALLKVLEEPPEHALFILTCENRGALLDTILSRATLISLQNPTVAECAKILEGLYTEQTADMLLGAARRARGSVGAARRLLDDPEAADEQAEAGAAELMELLLGDGELEALRRLRAWERDRAGLGRLLAGLSALAGERALENGPGAARISQLQQLKILAIIDESRSALDANANGLLLCTTLCARIRRVVEQME